MGSAPGHRNRGYGKAVVAFVTDAILEAGRTAVIGTSEENAPMLSLIRSLGFTLRRESDSRDSGGA